MMFTLLNQLWVILAAKKGKLVHCDSLKYIL